VGVAQLRGAGIIRRRIGPQRHRGHGESRERIKAKNAKSAEIRPGIVLGKRTSFYAFFAFSAVNLALSSALLRVLCVSVVISTRDLFVPFGGGILRAHENF
jgi:hypothetical protein